ncbi:(2Fe-2S)-binding protein [Megasphaera sp. ASD88]|uniref:(2Fe-2S)-binding protein n=1 Tax=unclassified Megasphaera TaxID=2626256 RepID=UPI000BAB90F7|nr:MULTISPECIES: 2Fe-2S iron-sulfur cluster-binding protein [unclassified Megasphaera]NJE34798.1 (2Fe-2S)-binding protein [Megasphaera sp. SW808]PAV38958.1 (2Fe-2S)-binding protein [Megasphaera sp. ASD88]
MNITYWLNGIKQSDEIEAGVMLLDFLRSKGCYSVKCGCETTNCGLCTVWIDEKPVLSCAVLAARIDGKRVTTLEGLQEEATEFAMYMGREGADQCGFCNPGFVMNVLAMARELEGPTEEDIKEYLAGNLCRCTGYVGHMRAIRDYLQAKGKAVQE